MTLIKNLAHALQRMGNNDNFITETHACGGGEWSVEVYFWNEVGEKEYVGELVGSNGNGENSQADDLWADFRGYIQAAKGYLAVWYGGGYLAK